jgi:hypothetical protein
MPNVRAIPTVRRRRLGRALRKFRTEAGLSLDQVAELMNTKPGAKWDGPKTSRIENANAKISAPEVVTLLGHYGVTDPETITALEELARTAGKAGWWSTYGGVVPSNLEDLIDAEEQAKVVRSYYVTVLPGLLQSGAYAREITAATSFHIPKEEHPAIVDVRMGRQAALTRPNPAEYWFVIHESLLLQKFTPHPSLMREQLLRLLDVSDLANVNLQVMPLDSGPHPGARGNFSIFHFPKPWPSLVSAESAGVSHYTEGQEAAERFQTDFDRIVASALPADRSRDTIRTHMEGMTR